MTAAGLAGAVCGLAVAGPVAALLGAGYACLAAQAGCARIRERRAAAGRAAAIDAVGGLAADLRAGLAPASALAEALPALRPARAVPTVARAVPTGMRGRSGRPGVEPTVARADALVTAAANVAERLGAPLAHLLDRVDADLRAAERCRASVNAQTSGVRVTSWLLAALPGAGVALGYGMGGDPLHVLLHTPIGAACAAGALLLQGAGLAWISRLCRGAVEEPV